MYKTVKPCKNAAQPKSAIQKRKRVVLNFVQKEEIIQKLKDGHAAKKLAVDFEVGISTIYDIGKSEEALVRHRNENPHSYMRSTFKTTSYPEVDSAGLCREKHNPVADQDEPDEETEVDR